MRAEPFAAQAVFPTRVGVDRSPRCSSGAGSVFPTRVGVDRAAGASRFALSCVPHARGGGPM